MMKGKFVFLFVVLCLGMTISAQAVIIEIDTAQELYDVRNNFDGDYVLTADIDLAGFAWRAIGYKDEGIDTGFTGTFDGQYYTISNLTAEDLNGTTSTSAGGNGFKTVSLFGVIGNSSTSSPGVVKNVGLINPNVRAGDYCGAFVGDLRFGEVSNCFVSGGTVSHETPSNNAGTFVGLVRGNGTITNCWSDAKMIFLNTVSGQGGFMNNSNDPESISYCYFAGTLEGIYSPPPPPLTMYGGPFRGNGGLACMLSCYYDETTTGIPNGTVTPGSIGTVTNQPPGRTTTEMMNQGTYVDWDFGQTWTMIPGQTYPKLAGFGLLAAGNPVPYGGIIPTTTSQLCWSAPEIEADGDPITGDITYNVYFGTDPNYVEEYPYGLTPLGTETSDTCVSVPPGTFETNNVYYWAVTSHTDGGDIPGLLWPLATAKTNASSPSPADGEPGAPRNAILSWTSGEDEFGELPDSHKLYMDPNATYVTERNCGLVDVCVTLPAGTTTYDPALEWGVTYYWVVDEDYGTGGIEEGDVWSFTVDPELECGPLPGDVTEDCLVNLNDFALLAYDWLNCLIINDNCPAGYN
jgi:hypothetical protein